jgi:hypothetical protein
MNVTAVPGEFGCYFVESGSGAEPWKVDLFYSDEGAAPRPACACAIHYKRLLASHCHHIDAARLHHEAREQARLLLGQARKKAGAGIPLGHGAAIL